MTFRNVGGGIIGRAMKGKQPLVVAAPQYVDAAPEASSDADAPLAPQPGQQTKFLSASADIVVFGGGAGAGKSRALTMEAARHQHVPGFTAVFFRRTYGEITNPDGLWDESKKVFGRLGWTPREGDLEWITPAGGRVVFSHAQLDKDVEKWKSAQIALLLLDQLETFTEYQFWYLFSRNRSTSGVRPYIRATLNCEPGWLADLLQWWWDPKSGYPIPARDGVVRWMARVKGELHWADTREALTERFGPKTRALSVSFIAGRLSDNAILREKDPDYEGKLLAMPIVEQERLLMLNFKIRPGAGKVLPRGKFTLLDAMPTDVVCVVRGWDNAATKGGGDWSSAVKLGMRANGRFIILHRWRDKVDTGERDTMMMQLAQTDTAACDIAIAQEPGSSGKDIVYHTVRRFAGFNIHAYPDTGDKLARTQPVAVQVAAGNVDVYVWNASEVELLLVQLDAFPTPKVADDDVDALTKAFKHLTRPVTEPQEWGEEDFSLV